MESVSFMSGKEFEGMEVCKSEGYYYFPKREVNYSVGEIEQWLSQLQVSEHEKGLIRSQLIS